MAFLAAARSKFSSSTAAGVSSTSKSGALKWVGANECGAEFGTNIPGSLGTDYIFPDPASIQTLMDKGMNIFRIPFLMERLAPSTMTSAFDATYLSGLQAVVSYVTTAGAHAVLDPHNYGRYNGAVFTSTANFKTFWTNLAREFKTNDKVIFDCNNEFHDEPSNALVVALNQACIDGVRAAGATSQYIFVEGTVSTIIPLKNLFSTSR
jgi:endoglucanase